VQWARALGESSVKPGMLVGLQHQNRYLHLLLIEACQLLGATSVSLSPADIAAHDPILDRCDVLCLQTPPERPSARLLVLDQAMIDQVGRQPIHTADIGMLDHAPAADAVVRLVRTSGSTGRAKVMAMTQAAMDKLLRKTLHMPRDPGHPWNFLNLYDFTLRSALRETEIALRLGLTAVMSSMETVFDDMRRVHGFRMTLVSGDALRLAGSIPPDWPGPRPGILSVKGGALNPAIRQTLREHVATHVYHNYATNETHRIAMIREDGIGEIEPGMLVRIVDEQGAERSPGLMGLIEVAPPLVDSYLWDEEATAIGFRDGWYRTYDLGVMPTPGELVVMGRADDMVSIGGVKFAPEAIERRIGALPGLREAVLLALTSRGGGEELAVALETDLTSLPPPLNREIVLILSGTVRSYRPYLLPSLPRTETGKVRRGALRDMLQSPARAT